PFPCRARSWPGWVRTGHIALVLARFGLGLGPCVCCQEGGGFLAPGRARRQERADSAARPLLENALGLWRKIGDESRIASTLVTLGMVAISSDILKAETLLQEGLPLARSTGDWAVIYWALQCLGTIAVANGDNAHGSELFEQSLALKLEHGDNWAAASSMAW